MKPKEEVLFFGVRVSEDSRLIARPERSCSMPDSQSVSLELLYLTPKHCHFLLHEQQQLFELDKKTFDASQ